MAVKNVASILSIASVTGGICTRKQLMAGGVPRGAIERSRAVGLLVPVSAGVYQIEALRQPSTELYRATLAVSGSVVSRRTAAKAHGFSMFGLRRPVSFDGSADDVHITARHGTSRDLKGAIVHETRLLLDEDRVSIGPELIATSPARTIFDLAGELSQPRLRHLIELQARDENPAVSEVHACFVSLRRRGVPGLLRLWRALVDVSTEDPIGGSELENRVWKTLLEYGIAGFERQVKPPWYDGIRGIVDFANRDLRIVLEADGRRWHSTDQSIVDDHRRDRLAASHGWVTIRVGWSEIVHRPAATMAEIQDVVQTRTAMQTRPAA